MVKQIIGVLFLVILCSFLPLDHGSAGLGTVVLQAADTIRPDTIKPEFTKTGNPVTGMAARYDADLDGYRTVSGETFFHAHLTVATNAFPMQSWLLVTNPANGQSVVVRVNDQLSKKQAKHSVVNLSQAGADALGISSKTKHFKIKLEQILPIDSLSFGNYYALEMPVAVEPKFEPKGKAVNGIASYYSANLDGTLTSTGERYRNYKMTAASNHFKLNTWVKVTNLRNGKSVIVRINDRMHPRMKAKGRVVDMSQEAARQLDYMKAGLTKVTVQPLAMLPPDVPEMDSTAVGDPAGK